MKNIALMIAAAVFTTGVITAQTPAEQSKKPTNKTENTGPSQKVNSGARINSAAAKTEPTGTVSQENKMVTEPASDLNKPAANQKGTAKKASTVKKSDATAKPAASGTKK